MSVDKGGLPQRSGTVMTRSSTGYASEDDAIPDEDNSEVTKLFSERLRAWKHACAYLEDYITATEKLHSGLGKDYEKVLKTVSHPLKEGEHFDQSLGGVAGMFDNIRTNTQAISNSHYETAKILKGSVLPTFVRLHTEIKNKSKELVKGAGKGSKAVEKARNTTQKHIELLGQHSASFDSTGGKIGAENDPYIIQRGVMHRLNKQIMEENANRSDLLGVQDNFASFEQHVVGQFQAGLGQFNTVISKQDDVSKSLYGDMVATAQRVPPNFEWQGFLKRYNNVLLDPNAPERNINNVNFPNQDHRATVPLISGSLERKGKVLKRYDTNFYVITPSKYLHEFKTDDDFSKDPLPENSLFLPDCVIGALDGAKFAVKGKDTSKSKIGINLSTSHEYSFRAHTPQDAVQWYEIIRQAAGQVSNEKPDISTPTSPISPATAEGEKFGGIPPGTATSTVAPTSAPTTAPPTTVPTTQKPHIGQETGVTTGHAAPLPEPTTHVGQPIPQQIVTSTHPAPISAPNTAAAPAATDHVPGPTAI